MQIKFDQEFVTICEEIAKENLTLVQWRQIESDDMFQSKHYCGGFDATEDAFCFSFYDDSGSEFWFQLSITEIEEILAGKRNNGIARTAL